MGAEYTEETEPIVIVDDTTPPDLDAQRAIVARVNDLRQPIYQDDTRLARNSLYAETQDERAALDKAFGDAPWSPAIHDTDELPIWLAAARMVPSLGLISPEATDPNTAPYHWSKVRCLFAGAGYKHHDAIAAVLSSLYPVCDMTVGEKEADWITALQKAHDVCGWPVHLARVHWSALVRALVWIDKSDPPSSWHRAVALLHMLKHIRTRGDKLAVAYGGLAALFPGPSSNVIALDRGTMAMTVQALGCPLSSGKEIHPLTTALQSMLKQISTDRLLPQRPLSELPGTVIAGPWSRVEPDPTATTGFCQTGLRLAGVWNASQGKVQEYTGSPVDAISWAWNLTDPNNHASVREALEASMPTTYPTGWPGDMMIGDFPNLDLSWATDQVCARVMLELPIFASLMRMPGSPLSREYPFILFLPDVPTMEDSTDQGKTAMTRTLVRAMSPGAPTVVPPDTASAPDNRAFVDVLCQYGTAGLDEWAPPQSRSHPLSHQNLQTLCTGGGITFGRVLENSGMVQLRHSLVAGCKAVEFPPDMVSRTFSWPMRRFTQAERSRQSVKARVDSGQASLQLRLAALHAIETYSMHGLLASALTSNTSPSSTMRFDAHAHLVAIIYRLRTGRICTTLDRTVQEMRARLNLHTSDAAASGVLSAQENGGYLNVRLADLLSGCGPDVIGMAEQEMISASATTARLMGRGWNTTTQLLTALCHARGFPSLQAMLPAIHGGKSRASDRQITLSLGRSIRSTIPEGGVYEIPESGWTIERGSDVSNSIRLRLVRASLLQSSGGQNDTWSLDK